MEDINKTLEETGVIALKPGTPEYEAFINSILKRTPEQEKAERELENKIINTDITIPEFKIKPEKLVDWQKGLANNTDPYGKACFVFANELARNLEDTMVDIGRPFNELTNNEIKQAEKKANEVVGGITGFMYGVAISCLSDVWEYGDELRKWHNAQMGQPEAKGTINPAIINLG